MGILRSLKTFEPPESKFYLVYVLCALYSVGVFEAHAIWRAEMRTPNIIKQLRETQTLSIDDLTPQRLKILLEIEDPTFFEHDGVDFSTPGQGISTLSQSLARRLYFDRYREGFSKIEQTLVTLNVLDWHFTKQDQITAFLNVAYFGSNNGRPVIGFDSAARVYFGKPFFQLNNDEYIGLVGMLAAPNLLHPKKHEAAFTQRVWRIKRVLRGDCSANGLLDTFYKFCGSQYQSAINGY